MFLWLKFTFWVEAWILSKDVVLAVQYLVYLVKQVISLVDTVQYSKGMGLGGGICKILARNWNVEDF